jgi:heme oxygenase
MQVVVSPDLTRDAYTDHLARLHGFYAAFEAQMGHVEGMADWLPDLAERQVKTAWIEADLVALGAAPPTDAEDCPLALDGVAEALGALYVVEGSTLGGRIIARMLERSIGVTPGDGADFYHSYGDERGARWTAYKAALDAFGEAHPEQMEAVIASAAQTFDAMERWMSVLAA